MSKGIKGNPSQINTAPKQQPAEIDKRGTEELPLVVKTVKPPKTQAEVDQERKENEEKAFQNRLTIWLAGIVAVATFLQAIFLYFTLRETKKAANAARDSAKVAETALHVAERAYLQIGNFELVNFSVGRHINIRYEIQNVGHTPAQIIDSLTIVDVVDKSILKEPPIYDTTMGTIGPKQSFIQPNEKTSMIGVSKNKIISEEVKSVDNNNKIIFAWGKITFCDVFGKTWVNGFGTVFSRVFGITTMDGYNYTKEYNQDKGQPF